MNSLWRNRGTCLNGRLTPLTPFPSRQISWAGAFQKFHRIADCLKGRDPQGSAAPFSSQEYSELNRGFRALSSCSFSSGRLCHDRLFLWGVCSREPSGGRSFPQCPTWTFPDTASSHLLLWYHLKKEISTFPSTAALEAEPS